MKYRPETKTVHDLLQLKAANMLYPNPEYQRAAVWTPAQKKRLIDSVFRGYPIPLFYLHHIAKNVAGAKREDFEIIDGQQRLNALYEYREGAFKTFDPIKDEEEARFPSFVREQPCPWGGKGFDDLTQELQSQMLGTPLSVEFIETDIPNEARDLFIRLQAGMPLNAQEKRDAWPGKFTEYVLRVGGKPEIARYPGHDFFTVVMKAKNKNRGEFRQLAAQMIMLYLTRRATGLLCDINRDSIDSFYHKNLDFDSNSQLAKRFVTILDLLTTLLGDGKRKKVGGHEAIGLVLLVDSLLDDYTASWRAPFADAFDSFRLSVGEAADTRYTERPSEFWLKYGLLTRANSDRADTIERRHQFFAEKMREHIKPHPKDSTRSFGELERELIYMREGKKCQAPGCGVIVLWADAEIHHVKEHSKGGFTSLENGALVHTNCHPKSAKEVANFAAHFGKAAASEPNGTPAIDPDLLLLMQRLGAKGLTRKQILEKLAALKPDEITALKE
jgi:Protein of unknown function DUF262/HNH endonuclease